MKKLGFILVIISLFNTNLIIAQDKSENCACCDDNYKQFDFWLGEWDVFDVNDSLVGTNTIKKQYDNCVLQEKWISSGKGRGTSYNFFDKTDGTWNQVWIDNSGYVLRLKGNLVNGSMILKSEIIEGNKGSYYNQISWTKNEDGSVTQLWENFNKKNSKISEAFSGIYKKRLN